MTPTAAWPQRALTPVALSVLPAGLSLAALPDLLSAALPQESPVRLPTVWPQRALTL